MVALHDSDVDLLAVEDGAQTLVLQTNSGPFTDAAQVYRNSLLAQHEAHPAGVSRSDWFARTCGEPAGSAEKSLVQRDECSRHHEIARGLTRQNRLVATP